MNKIFKPILLLLTINTIQPLKQSTSDLLSVSVGAIAGATAALALDEAHPAVQNSGVLTAFLGGTWLADSLLSYSSPENRLNRAKKNLIKAKEKDFISHIQSIDDLPSYLEGKNDHWYVDKKNAMRDVSNHCQEAERLLHKVQSKRYDLSSECYDLLNTASKMKQASEQMESLLKVYSDVEKAKQIIKSAKANGLFYLQPNIENISKELRRYHSKNWYLVTGKKSIDKLTERLHCSYNLLLQSSNNLTLDLEYKISQLKAENIEAIERLNRISEIILSSCQYDLQVMRYNNHLEQESIKRQKREFERKKIEMNSYFNNNHQQISQDFDVRINRAQLRGW